MYLLPVVVILLFSILCILGVRWRIALIGAGALLGGYIGVIGAGLFLMWTNLLPLFSRARNDTANIFGISVGLFFGIVGGDLGDRLARYLQSHRKRNVRSSIIE